MNRYSRSSAPSLPPPDASVLIGAAELLASVEALAPDDVGILQYGSSGNVLVESRGICWAFASGMKRRLSTLLRQQRSPPLELSFIEDTLEECRRNRRPLGEALLATGHISEEGLRMALFSHVVEAVARIAQSGADCAGFTPHDGVTYDPRFVFSPAEVLAALGGRRDRAQAAAAKRGLRTTLVPGSRGLAFVRDSMGPVAIAVEGTPALRVPEILDMCSWASTLFDVTTVFDDDVRVATGSGNNSNAVVTWKAGDTQFVAVCENRAASALLMARLDETLVSNMESRT
jgi:hypothetical protein